MTQHAPRPRRPATVMTALVVVAVVSVLSWATDLWAALGDVPPRGSPDAGGDTLAWSLLSLVARALTLAAVIVAVVAFLARPGAGRACARWTMLWAGYSGVVLGAELLPGRVLLLSTLGTVAELVATGSAVLLVRRAGGVLPIRPYAVAHPPWRPHPGYDSVPGHYGADQPYGPPPGTGEPPVYGEYPAHPPLDRE